MNINKLLIKQIAILSSILGLILGVITIIPYLGFLSFFVCVFFASTLVLWYLKKLNLIGILTPKDGGIYGLISGFIVFIGFCITFLPLSALIGYFVRGYFYSGILFLFQMGIVILAMMIIFVALISALFNALIT